ncbi:MAG: peptidylprolyl isomerase [Burkholderiaceae bacterium]
MTDRHHPVRNRARLAGLILALWGAAWPVAQAQGLRLSPNMALRAGPTTPVDADFIVALVNAEPVTNHEVRQATQRLGQQLQQRGVQLPPAEQLAQQALDQLVSEKALVQHAVEIGVRVDDAALLQAEQSVAAQNSLSVEAFRSRLKTEGIDQTAFREDLRRQILMQRLREREVGRVQVSESDIDDALRALQATASREPAVNLGHVLVQVPESASEAQVRSLEARAREAAERARAGDDFAAIARTYSDASEGATGGEFGMRPYSRLPELFVQSTRNLAVGQVAGPIRSPAGFHVLKVVGRQDGDSANARVLQTRASHILLRTGPQLSEAQAVERLASLRQQLQSGQSTFEALAREHSQDGSARQGGDLGWAEPGMFVPEFEQVMNALKPGEVSEPVVSRFGVHLIRVDQRRERQLATQEQRELIRGQLRERRAEEALQSLVQDVRGRAYVEFRDPPRP